MAPRASGDRGECLSLFLVFCLGVSDCEGWVGLVIWEWESKKLKSVVVFFKYRYIGSGRVG